MKDKLVFRIEALGHVYQCCISDAEKDNYVLVSSDTGYIFKVEKEIFYEYLNKEST